MSRYLKLGVAVPMKNHSFMKGTAFDSECTVLDPGRGDNAIAYISQTPTLFATLNKGDMIKIGASTNDSNLRATEELMVSKVVQDNDSFGIISLDSTNSVLFHYSKPDKISGVGNYFPDSWSAPTASVINAFGGDIFYIPKLDGLNLPDYSDMVSGADKTNLETFTTYGIDDYYCSKILMRKSSGTGSVDVLRYNFGIGDILESTYYRIGFFYRYKIYNQQQSPGIVRGKTQFHDGSSLLTDSTYFSKSSNYEESDWRLYVGDTVQTASSLSSAGYILFNLKLTGGISLPRLLHNIDCVWVEHAKWTDDDTDGVYTFTEHPALGTQTWNFEEFRQVSRLAIGTNRYGQKDGRKRPRWRFSCRFEDVGSTFWKNLLILQQWGKLGYKIVFHTSEEFSYRVPPVIMGKIKLKNIQKNSWANEVKSFTFMFEESE